MMKTREIAIDLLNGQLDVADLASSIEFLEEVDHSLVAAVKEIGAWSDSTVSHKRKALFDRVEYLKHG